MIFSTSFVIEIMPAKYNDNIYLAPFTPDEDLLPGNKSCAPLSYCKATGRLVITGRVHCHITSCLCSHIYFFCSHHKQLNGHLNGITFVVLIVHEQVPLMSFSWSKMHLLLYVHEPFAMSLHLLSSIILHLLLLSCANNSAVGS